MVGGRCKQNYVCAASATIFALSMSVFFLILSSQWVRGDFHFFIWGRRETVFVHLIICATPDTRSIMRYFL